MSVSVITVANLGAKKNLKTADILPVIDKLAAEGELKQVICQVAKDFYFPNTSSAVPSLVRYSVEAFGRITGLPVRRPYQVLLDFFACLKLQEVDVCLLHPGPTMPKAALAARKRGIVTVNVATIIDPRQNNKIEQEEAERFGVAQTERIENAAPQRYSHRELFDYVVAFSENVKQSYIESGFPAERIFVAHSDIALPPPPAPRPSSTPFKVLYVAYTSPRKGLQYLLKAWSEMRLPGAELVLVGKYSGMPEAMQRYCDSIIQNDPSIVWAGGTQDPAQYYRDASAFVLPSLSEGNPRVVMEAMAHSLPVVVTGPAQSVVKDGKSGFVVPARDWEALKEKIEYLYHNRDAAARMGQEARQAMEHKKPFGEAVFEIYKEILRRESKHR